MKWHVDLHGDVDDLENLSKIFCSPDLHILKKNGGYVLESSSFDDCFDSGMVNKKADRILIAINATKLLALKSSEQIQKGAIQGRDDEGKTTISLVSTFAVTASMRVRSTVIENDGSIKQDLSTRSLPKWVPLIETDEKVRRVFELMIHDFDSYIGLYKILEVIQEDNFPPVMRGGEYYNIIDLFKRTAESYAAVGIDARHAHSRFTKPPKPMKIQDARILFIKIIQKWLDSKI